MRWGKRLIDQAVREKASRSTRGPPAETGGDVEVEDEEAELARKKRKDINDVLDDETVEPRSSKRRESLASYVGKEGHGHAQRPKEEEDPASEVAPRPEVLRGARSAEADRRGGPSRWT